MFFDGWMCNITCAVFVVGAVCEEGVCSGCSDCVKCSLTDALSGPVLHSPNCTAYVVPRLCHMLQHYLWKI